MVAEKSGSVQERKVYVKPGFVLETGLDIRGQNY